MRRQICKASSQFQMRKVPVGYNLFLVTNYSNSKPNMSVAIWQCSALGHIFYICFMLLLEKQSPYTYCHKPNDSTTQPQHNINTVVGMDTKMTVATIQPPHPTHHTNSTLAFRSLRLTFINNNNNNNNNKINSFGSLRLTFIDN